MAAFHDEATFQSWTAAVARLRGRRGTCEHCDEETTNAQGD